jgi:hypothetical protein
MKKITCGFIIFLFSIFINQPANANMSVSQLVGAGVIQSQASSGTNTNASSNGSFAIVDSNGSVTNIIVCSIYCANGTFGPGGDPAVPQIPDSNVGIWFGPRTTTYNKENKTFTATNPTPQEIKLTDGDSSVTIFANEVLTFVSGNIFVSNGTLVGVDKSWSLDSTANVSVTESNTEESLYLGNRKTNQEVRSLIEESELLLLNKRVEVLINLLGSWIK